MGGRARGAPAQRAHDTARTRTHPILGPGTLAVLYCTVCSAGPRAHARGGVEWVAAERGREGGRSGEGVGEVQIGRTTHPHTPPPPRPASLPLCSPPMLQHTHITPCAPWLRQSFSCVSHLLYMHVPPTSLLFVHGSPMPKYWSPLLSDICTLITMTGHGHPHTHHALISVRRWPRLVFSYKWCSIIVFSFPPPFQCPRATCSMLSCTAFS